MGVRRVAVLAVLLCGPVLVPAGEDTVQLTKTDDAVSIRIGDEEIATFHFAQDLPKPYFWPVRAPGGVVVTRPIENPKDHPHHRGVWIAVDEVNDIKFWAEDGRIQNRRVTLPVASGDPAKMLVENDWQGPDGRPVLTETTDVSVYPSRLFSFRVKLTAGDQPVTFDDTKEGFFGIRVVDSMRESVGGLISDAKGQVGSDLIWGHDSKWVDYSGPVGESTVGVALFDHPSNFRPSRYHARNYGLFSISPFGEHAYTNGRLPADPVTLSPGESLELRYGLYVHAGDAQAGRVSDVYLDYLRQQP